MTVPLPSSNLVEIYEKSKLKDDYSELFYEWYRCVAQFVQFIVSLDPTSPCFKDFKKEESMVFIGLLNRCSRLMLSNMKLSNNGIYGETTVIIDRCILESCVKIIWFCKIDSADRFKRYIAESLKAERELKRRKACGPARRGKCPLGLCRSRVKQGSSALRGTGTI